MVAFNCHAGVSRVVCTGGACLLGDDAVRGDSVNTCVHEDSGDGQHNQDDPDGCVAALRCGRSRICAYDFLRNVWPSIGGSPTLCGSWVRFVLSTRFY